MSSIIEKLQSLGAWLLSFLSGGPKGSLGYKSNIVIQGRRLKVLKQIGEGGFSYVYLAKGSDGDDSDIRQYRKKSGRDMFAIKKLRIVLEEQEKAFTHEINMYVKIGSHPNVLTLICSSLVTIRDCKEGYLLFPFYKRGTVQDLILSKQGTNEKVSEIEIKKLLNGICQGLMAFHSQNPPLAFRDLKPANVLIDSDGNAILMDLGSVDIARLTLNSRQDALRLQEKCAETCTAPYRGPELFDIASNSTFDERSDVWSLGCTLFAMCYYNSPFEGTATSAMSGKITFPATTTYTQKLHDLITSMLQVDAQKRPFVPAILLQLSDSTST